MAAPEPELRVFELDVQLPARPDASTLQAGRLFVENILNSSTEQASAAGDNWLKYMLWLGVGPRSCQMIMREEFKDLRLTATCRTWLLRCILHSPFFRRFTNGAQLAGIDLQVYPLQAFAQQPKTRPRDFDTDRCTHSFMGGRFYLPVGKEQALNLWGSSSLTLRPEILARPGDFSCLVKMLYCLDHKKTAERLARWLPIANPVVLELDLGPADNLVQYNFLPTAIAGLTADGALATFACDMAWKEAVLYSRHRRPPPLHLDHLVMWDVLRGPIPTTIGFPASFKLEESRDWQLSPVWKTAMCLTYKDQWGQEVPVQQYAFNGPKAMRWIKEQVCMKKSTIIIHPIDRGIDNDSGRPDDAGLEGTQEVTAVDQTSDVH